MAAIWRGSFEITEDAKNDIEIDMWGVAGGTLYYWGPFDLAVGFVLSKLQHPDYSWLRRKSAAINRQEANYSEIRITFAGVPPNTNEKTYRCTGATSSEPIETHPKFVSDLAGTPTSPITANNPKFTNGKFVGFGTGPLIGLKSYLNGNLNYEETKVLGLLSGFNSMTELGYVDNPPSSPVLPTDLGERNWLMTGGNVEPVGLGGKVVRGWKLSSQTAWKAVLYQP